jgi:hypothetical protein
MGNSDLSQVMKYAPSDDARPGRVGNCEPIAITNSQAPGRCSLDEVKSVSLIIAGEATG